MDLLEDRHESGIRLTDELSTFLHGLARLFDQGGDIATSLGRSLCQVADFGRDNSKAKSLFTGSCSFHPGIERQEVGLHGDAVDHAEHLLDLARHLLDAFHCLRDSGDDPGGVACLLGGLPDAVLDLHRVLHRLLHSVIQ